MELCSKRIQISSFTTFYILYTNIFRVWHEAPGGGLVSSCCPPSVAFIDPRWPRAPTLSLISSMIWSYAFLPCELFLFLLCHIYPLNNLIILLLSLRVSCLLILALLLSYRQNLLWTLISLRISTSLFFDKFWIKFIPSHLRRIFTLDKEFFWL